MRAELEPGPDAVCAVTNDHAIVVGRVRWKDLPEDDDVRVGQFMQLGPATVRPRGELRDLVERMRAARVKAILVTSGKGRLLGVVNGDDGERLVKEREGRSRTAESVT